MEEKRKVKKMKMILALVLVACLCLALFAACAKTEEPASNNPSTSTDKPADTSKPADTDKPAETDKPAAESKGLVPFEDERELVVVLYDMRATGEDYGDPVEEYCNGITKETLNVVCDYQWVIPGNWANKVDVGLSSGERIDVLNLNPMTRASKYYPTGQLMRLNEYIEDYAPEAYELTKEYIGTYTFDGNIVGFPTVRNYCKNGYVLMRTDVLEELGMVDKALNMTTWTEFEEILQAVKENYEGVYAPIGMSSPASADNFAPGENFSDCFPYDNMGDSVGVLYADQESGKVKFIQEEEVYQYNLRRLQRWWDNGWMWQESAFTTEFVDVVMSRNVLFCNICGSEYGVEATKETAYGFDLTVTQFVTGMVKTNQPTFTGIAVPITAEEPEAAVAFINELYTNPDLAMALVYGVPGKDYNIENGEVVRTPDAGFLSIDFVLGNNYLLKPLQGTGPDFYEVVKQINATADKSKFLGFNITTTDMDMWLSQISTVTDQYNKSIMYGGFSDEVMAEYIGKLEQAGVRDYQAAAQEQLDAFVAAK